MSTKRFSQNSQTRSVVVSADEVDEFGNPWRESEHAGSVTADEPSRWHPIPFRPFRKCSKTGAATAQPPQVRPADELIIPQKGSRKKSLVAPAVAQEPKAAFGGAAAPLDPDSPANPSSSSSFVKWDGSKALRKNSRMNAAGNVGPILSGMGMPEKRAEYIEQTLHPLFKDMVGEAIHVLPINPALFCLHWLLRYFVVPESLTKPLLDWVDESLVDGNGCNKTPLPLVEGRATLPLQVAPQPQAPQQPRQAPPTPQGSTRPPSARSSALKPSTSSNRKDSTSPSREPDVVMGRCASAGSEQPPRPPPGEVAEVAARALLPRKSILKANSRASSRLPSTTGILCSPDQDAVRAEAAQPPSRPRTAPRSSVHIVTKPSADDPEALGRGAEPSSAKSPTSRSPPAPPPGEPAWRSRRRRSFRRVPKISVEEIVKHLGKIPIISEFNEEEQRTLAGVCTVKQFDSHAEVIRCGDVTQEIIVVLEGSCRVFVPQLVETLYPGDWFGEGALLKGLTNAEASLCAPPDKELTVLSLDVGDMEALGLKKHFAKKYKKTDASRFIAHPELHQQGSPSTGVAGTHNVGRVATDVPEYSVDVEYHEKSSQDREHIKVSVRRNQYLTDLLQLSDAQVDEIASCMKLSEVGAGDVIIQKGDPGSKFYVIHDGLLEVLLQPDPKNPIKNVDGVSPVQLYAGDSFGELALLYDSPRKASVVSKRPSSLWVLELRQWRNVLKKMPATRIDEYLGLLNGIPDLCKRVQVGKMRKLADSLEEVYYQAGEVVVKKGERTGLALYIIFDGTCVVSDGNHELKRLQKGDRFGEEMLRSIKKPCPFTVAVASETATILVLDHTTVDAVADNVADPVQGGPRDGAADAESEPASPFTRRRSLMHMSLGADVPMNRRTKVLERNRQTFPRDQLERVGILGTGSFALVTLEHDPVSNRLFALKAMPKKSIVEKGIKNMVLGERKALVELDSPFVVSLITTYQDARAIFFLLEPALGGELFALYNEHDDWFGNEVLATFFVSCVALGLQHIHTKKLIHRDIKLENILLCQSGYARITDLGLAKVLVGKTYTVCGSSDYLAPETLKQVGHNRAVDWWALGILTFCMMSGRMPFDAKDVMQIYKNIVKGFRKDHFPQTFSTALVDFISGLCRKKPQERMTMLPGGVSNLASHAWLDDGNGDRWKAISEREYPPPYRPPSMSVEQLRATMKQETDFVGFDDYEDDGTDWAKPF